jgi:hypothetical protein
MRWQDVCMIRTFGATVSRGVEECDTRVCLSWVALRAGDMA